MAKQARAAIPRIAPHAAPRTGFSPSASANTAATKAGAAIPPRRMCISPSLDCEEALDLGRPRDGGGLELVPEEEAHPRVTIPQRLFNHLRMLTATSR